MPIVVTDARQPDLPIVLANEAFLKLTGYSAGEVIGRNCRFLQGKATSRTAVAEIRAAIAQHRDATIEVLNYKKDGTPFWNQLHISALRDADGEVAYYFASQIDVTELRRTRDFGGGGAPAASGSRPSHEECPRDRRRRRSSVEDRQRRGLRRFSPAACPERWRGRICCLPKTDGRTSRWTRSCARRSACSTATMLWRRGPEVMIPAPSVQPIGLALHELVANAAVHGALAHPGGHLKISWRREGDGLALDWEESGLTLSPKQHGRGFGTVLLGAVLEKQLGGTITRDWRADGLSLRIALPALNRVGGGLRAKP